MAQHSNQGWPPPKTGTRMSEVEREYWGLPEDPRTEMPKKRSTYEPGQLKFRIRWDRIALASCVGVIIMAMTLWWLILATGGF